MPSEVRRSTVVQNGSAVATSTGEHVASASERGTPCPQRVVKIKSAVTFAPSVSKRWRGSCAIPRPCSLHLFVGSYKTPMTSKMSLVPLGCACMNFYGMDSSAGVARATCGACTGWWRMGWGLTCSGPGDAGYDSSNVSEKACFRSLGSLMNPGPPLVGGAPSGPRSQDSIHRSETFTCCTWSSASHSPKPPVHSESHSPLRSGGLRAPKRTFGGCWRMRNDADVASVALDTTVQTRVLQQLDVQSMGRETNSLQSGMSSRTLAGEPTSIQSRGGKRGFLGLARILARCGPRMVLSLPEWMPAVGVHYLHSR